MALDERDRIFRKLSQAIGEEEAGLLMASLPTTAPASKQDLDELEARVDRRFDALEERFDHKLESLEHRLLGALFKETSALRADIINQGRTFTVTMAGSVLALVSLVVVDRLL
jgi:hypothetical protein